MEKNWLLTLDLCFTTFVTLSSPPPPFGAVNTIIFVTIPLLRCFWDVTCFLASGWCIFSHDYRNHSRFLLKIFFRVIRKIYFGLAILVFWGK